MRERERGGEMRRRQRAAMSKSDNAVQAPRSSAQEDFERKLELLRVKKINKQLKGEVGEAKAALRRAKRSARARGRAGGEGKGGAHNEETKTKQGRRHQTKEELTEAEHDLRKALRKEAKKRKMLEAALDREMASDRGLLARAREAKSHVRAKDRIIEELLDDIRTVNRFIETSMRKGGKKTRKRKGRGGRVKGTGTRFFDDSKAELIEKLERQLAGLKSTWVETKKKAAKAAGARGGRGSERAGAEAGAEAGPGAGIPTEHEMRAEMRQLRAQMKADRILLERLSGSTSDSGQTGASSSTGKRQKAPIGVVGDGALQQAKMEAWDQQQKLRISKKLAKKRALKAAEEARAIKAKLEKFKSRERAARVEKDRIEERLQGVQSKLEREFWRRAQNSAAQMTRVARLFVLRKRGEEALVGAEVVDEAFTAAVTRVAES